MSSVLFGVGVGQNRPVVLIDDVGGLGPVEVEPARGGGPVTPASRVCARAIARSRHLLWGVGIDWGTGTGLLAILAARIPTVERVVAVEYDRTAVETARANAARNGVADRVTVVHADLFTAFDPADQPTIDSLEGQAAFLLANPPHSDEGDGLEWRRRVLAGARRLLRPGAVVLLQVSAHYTEERIRGLASEGYEYVETVETSDWVPFDLSREDLRRALTVYVAEEDRGGIPYEFRLADGRVVSAHEVAAGAGDPHTRWQVHHIRYSAPPNGGACSSPF